MNLIVGYHNRSEKDRSRQLLYRRYGLQLITLVFQAYNTHSTTIESRMAIGPELVQQSKCGKMVVSRKQYWRRLTTHGWINPFLDRAL